LCHARRTSICGIIDEEGRKRDAKFAMKINESDTRDRNGNTSLECTYPRSYGGPFKFPCRSIARLPNRRCCEHGEMHISSRIMCRIARRLRSFRKRRIRDEEEDASAASVSARMIPAARNDQLRNLRATDQKKMESASSRP
jgi:hypothetical protein